MKLIDYRATIPTAMSRFGLYLFAFSIPISFVPAEFAIGIAFVGWILEGLFNKQWQYYPTKLFIPLLFYIGWNIIASSISPRPGHSLWALADNEWPMFIMLLMYFVVDDIKVLKRILQLWLFSASIAALYGIWQTFSGYQLHRPETLAPMGSYFRAVGFNGFYLTFAGFLMSVFLVSLCMSSQSGMIKNRWKYLLVALLSFMAVIGTFARSIWLSFGVVIPVFGFVKGKRIGSIVTGVFLLIVLFCVIFIPTIRDRAYSSVVPSENQTRLNLWKTSINISKDFPLTGIGEDNFDYYFDRYKVAGYYDVTGHPHNDYLTILVSSGIPGLIAFLSLWFVLIQTGFKTQKYSTNPFLKELALGSTLAVIGFMIGGLFQNYYGTFANCWGWWLMAGLVMASSRLSTKEDKIKS
ncbi:MAG: O-antigen ligase family protein [Ignavibacteriales bacterium]|nr:O-antigen ligase family protein [Ignavibacteriales bacterium]